MVDDEVLECLDAEVEQLGVAERHDGRDPGQVGEDRGLADDLAPADLADDVLGPVGAGAADLEPSRPHQVEAVGRGPLPEHDGATLDRRRHQPLGQRGAELSGHPATQRGRGQERVELVAVAHDAIRSVFGDGVRRVCARGA